MLNQYSEVASYATFLGKKVIGQFILFSNWQQIWCIDTYRNYTNYLLCPFFHLSLSPLPLVGNSHTISITMTLRMVSDPVATPDPSSLSPEASGFPQTLTHKSAGLFHSSQPLFTYPLSPSLFLTALRFLSLSPQEVSRTTKQLKRKLKNLGKQWQ